MALATMVGRFVRNVAQQLDQLGLAIQGNYAFREQLSRHRRLLALGDKRPVIKGDVFIAPNASVIGSVQLEEGASVWYGSVIRGDVGNIKVGEGAVLGDNTVVHVSSAVDGTFNTEKGTEIGKRAIVENGAVLHACSLHDECKVEANSIIFDGAVVEKHAIVGAGSIVTTGKRIPSGQLWAGSPAKYVRDLTDSEKKALSDTQQRYQQLAKKHEFEHDKFEQWKAEERKYFPHLPQTF
eukprot:TRINITY_DN126_c0_g1_i2.p1 TRINITY_DN126_c0_g1~~TRINITY_DN126_c0_g1_i2.p1  ORF type:complete len:238 (-),score=62.98 TRINITY_DN126_c0_g1_i2:125-838(-)